MGGRALTTMSQILCPHGGQVQIISTNTRVMAGSAPIVSAKDTFIVVGCPFQIPAVVPIPSPCVMVRWLVSDMHTEVNGTPTLSESSSGLCLSAAQVPQEPAIIVSTQPEVSSK